ncbi:helix-turn-helix domain-containing protein [Streptomyces avicenniae]|uniref:helix-turn-helix domain-containing protein n=1 Tax=Streptomyces avicenniae TaxID=500153 RepID=UPI0006992BAB|nr:helix-turn-helix transcriptional regulator [Streptomyces avicenniae]
MPVEHSGSAALRQLGSRLRTMRDTAGRSVRETAAALGVPPDRVRGLEAGRIDLEPAWVRPLLTLYGRQAETDSVLAEAAGTRRAAWWEAYRDIVPQWLADQLRGEEQAEVIRLYAPLFLPDLLQIPAYGAALLRGRTPDADEAEVARSLDVLARRQAVLDRSAPRPPVLWALIEESALRRRVGGPEVMYRQLAHLRALAARPGVTIRVTPLHTTHIALMSGPVQYLRFRAPELADRLLLQTGDGATVTEQADVVRHYLMALDSAASVADSVPIGEWSTDWEESKGA